MRQHAYARKRASRNGALTSFNISFLFRLCRYQSVAFRGIRNLKSLSEYALFRLNMRDFFTLNSYSVHVFASH